MESKDILMIHADNTGYDINQIKETMTVGELIKFLEDNYDEDKQIYMSFDNGFTYGGITEDKIHMAEAKENENGETEIEELD